MKNSPIEHKKYRLDRSSSRYFFVVINKSFIFASRLDDKKHLITNKQYLRWIRLWRYICHYYFLLSPYSVLRIMRNGKNGYTNSTKVKKRKSFNEHEKLREKSNELKGPFRKRFQRRIRFETRPTAIQMNIHLINMILPTPMLIISFPKHADWRILTMKLKHIAT